MMPWVPFSILSSTTSVRQWQALPAPSAGGWNCAPEAIGASCKAHARVAEDSTVIRDNRRMLSQRSERSLAPIEREHLDRLAALADIQHAQFVREGARAHSWENRRVAVVLAQGGALHYLDGVTGVKDFD